MNDGGTGMMESVLQLYGLAMVIFPVYAFVSLRKKLRHRLLSKPAALLRYVVLVLAPIVGYACVFALAIGIEELTPYSMVSEEIARSFVLAVVLGMLILLLGTTIFALSLFFLQTSQKPDLQRY